jgi:hypothetical protein
MSRSSWRNDPYTGPLLRAFICQVLLLCLYSLFLDLGQHIRACCGASVGFWLGAILILVRRPRHPTAGDLAYIRWGLVPIILVGSEAFVWVWKLRGVY